MIHQDLKLILEEASDQMDNSLEHLRAELRSIRAGRATPAMLENVKVDYYGSQTPLSQMASVSAPQADLLIVQPWDRSALEEIEKAILTADLGLNPNNDGQMIRLPVPPLSEERRKELAKTAHTRGEEAKISVRNVRRNAKDMIKTTQQEENLQEDMRYEAEERLQELTDKHTELIDKLMEKKEKEIMEV